MMMKFVNGHYFFGMLLEILIRISAQQSSWAAKPLHCSLRGGGGGIPWHIGTQRVGTYILEHNLLYMGNWAPGYIGSILEFFSGLCGASCTA